MASHPEGLTDRKIFSPSSGGWKSELKVLAGLILLRLKGRSVLLASLPVLMTFPHCYCIAPIFAFTFTRCPLWACVPASKFPLYQSFWIRAQPTLV